MAAARRKVARRALTACVVVLIGCGSGCVFTGERAQTRASSRAGQLGKSPEEIQSELMAFADTYTGVVAQLCNDLLLADDPIETRRVAIGVRNRMVSNALLIASSKNPVAALMDMAVMISLQRQVWEEHWGPVYFSDDRFEVVVGNLAMLERQIWDLAASVLSEEQTGALRLVVEQMQERHVGHVFVSSLRASDFAAERHESLLRIRGGASLLSLFGLDPLSNLSPTTRQIAESRLLGERMFFFAGRAPSLLRWQFEEAVLDLVSEPESQRLIASAELASDSARRAADVATDLSSRLTEERIAAIDQAAAMLGAEREAAIDQFFEGLSAEREALLGGLDEDHEQLRGTLTEVRGAIENATALSESLERTMRTSGELAQAVERLRNPDARPLDLAELDAVLVSATEGIRELHETILRANELVATLGAGEQSTALQTVLADGKASADAIIDRAFYRGLLLVAAVFGGMIVYRLATARLGAPRAALPR